MTRHLLVGAALLLAGTSGAWAQAQTAAQPHMATSAYGASGVYAESVTTPDGHLMGVPAYVNPNDPSYSYFEPVHRGQASESSAAASSWAGPYTQLGHDSGM